jgi:hypothetical protein
VRQAAFPDDLVQIVRYPGGVAPRRLDGENLLNRPGIFALKTPARRLGQNPPGDWETLIDPARAQRAARAIA